MFQNIVNPFPSTTSRRDLDYCKCLNVRTVSSYPRTKQQVLTGTKVADKPLLLRSFSPYRFSLQETLYLDEF